LASANDAACPGATLTERRRGAPVFVPPIERCSMKKDPSSTVQEFPAIDAPKFEQAAAQASSAFHDLTEKGISQANEGYAKMKKAAEEATSAFETSCNNAAKGMSDCSLKMVEIARASSNANFDFAAGLLGARTLAQMVEITTSHTRKQIELATAQAKEVAKLFQEMAHHTAEPMKESFTKLMQQAA
jgi:phasin